MSGPRWLLLAHQLPTRSSNARVKTWRRLQQIGAVPARNSLYVLPNTDACREDFEWMRSEIVALGGDATVFSADAISEGGTEDIVGAFQRARDLEYGQLGRDINRVASSMRRKRLRVGASRQSMGRTIRALRARFNAIERIDFFTGAARERTASAVAELERALDGGRAGGAKASKVAGDTLRKADYRGRRWVTRPRPGVDRMSSAWLIRRFIDPKATFAFVDRPSGADVPFDMYSGDFSHHGKLCTFEVLCQRFGIDNQPAIRIGRIVHDLDMKESTYAPPEAPAVERMIEGLRRLYADDSALLEQGMAMFEALARSFET